MNILRDDISKEIKYNEILVPHIELMANYFNIKYGATNEIDFVGFELNKFANIKPSKEELIKAITNPDSKFYTKKEYNKLIKEWQRINAQFDYSQLEEKIKIEDEIIKVYSKDLLNVGKYIEHLEEEEKEILLHYLEIEINKKDNE
ncbi:hypothetical protein COJ41_13185 [Bacillus thuringiensis]|uniref:hypothetical protein n=1 Tax=Bacillus thuringiensis TaxID=1428 RepID=UPI000BF27B98|nr:hypothetical protein [Bacillus thuringiensis]PFM22658.1 hypothetical protein COJ41_13185 [Bacillus thuringiensis]